MGNKKINKIAEEKAFDYQRGLGMIDSVSDDHIVARRMGFYDGFKSGAEWDRVKMMEEAEECTVVDFSSYLPRPQVDIRLDPGKYHSGDKVKVIVIKEDDFEI